MIGPQRWSIKTVVPFVV